MERWNGAYSLANWLKQHPEAIIHNMSIMHSDHAPILLVPNPTTLGKKLVHPLSTGTTSS